MKYPVGTYFYWHWGDLNTSEPAFGMLIENDKIKVVWPRVHNFSESPRLSDWNPENHCSSAWVIKPDHKHYGHFAALHMRVLLDGTLGPLPEELTSGKIEKA